MSASDCPDREHLGFRECNQNPLTGKWNSIYIAAIAGFESDPDQLYVVTCEEHGEQTSARSLATAKILADNAAVWCKHCQALSLGLEGTAGHAGDGAAPSALRRPAPPGKE